MGRRSFRARFWFWKWGNINVLPQNMACYVRFLIIKEANISRTRSCLIDEIGRSGYTEIIYIR